MAKYKYSAQADDKMARAVLRSAEISFKQSIEICNYLRGRRLDVSKKILNDAMALKKAIPFKRFVADGGHKAGMGPGKYAIKASKMILSILESAEANAQFKSLDTSSLVIKHISAQKASRPFRMGRQRGRKGKRTTIEVILMESVSDRKSKAKPANAEKEEKKPELHEERSADKKEEKKPEQNTSDKEEKKPVKKAPAKKAKSSDKAINED